MALSRYVGEALDTLDGIWRYHGLHGICDGAAVATSYISNCAIVPSITSA